MNFSLADFCDQIQNLLKVTDKKDRDQKILQVMAQSELDKKFWECYAERNETPYTRNRIAATTDFELLLLCWNPQARSPIHDHAGSDCWMKCLEGTMVQDVFFHPKGNAFQLVPMQTTDIEKNQVALINDSIGVHQMKNPSLKEKSITLHLYVPPINQYQTYPEKVQ